MIDIDSILDKLVLVARDAVGSSLSTIGPNNDIPAVILERGEGVEADSPYITLDVLSIRDEGSWLRREYLNDLDEAVFENVKLLLLRYSVYGSNSLTIANNLHSYFKIEQVLDDIQSTLEANIVELTQIRKDPQLRPGSYLESHHFNFSLNVYDRVTVTGQTSRIQSISNNGQLKRNEDDPNPLDITITT